MSDVPFGVFLSGGMDSTSDRRADGASCAPGRHVHGRASPISPHLNELDYARAGRASSSSTDHHEVLVDEREMQRIPAVAGLLAGRADRRLGVHPAVLRVEARARQRAPWSSRWARAATRSSADTTVTWATFASISRYWQPVPAPAGAGAAAGGGGSRGSRGDRQAQSTPTSSTARRKDREHFWGGACRSGSR